MIGDRPDTSIARRVDLGDGTENCFNAEGVFLYNRPLLPGPWTQATDDHWTVLRRELERPFVAILRPLNAFLVRHGWFTRPGDADDSVGMTEP